jgi:hypothetical protein
MTAENRVLNAFRNQYRQSQSDLDAFDRASSAQTFIDAPEAVAWCRLWWEERLHHRTLDHGERQLRGTQNRN